MHFTHPSFAAGELSEKTLARSDLERQHIGLARCRNFRVMKEGGLENRAGLRFLGEAKYGTTTVVLYRFERSATASYVLEFGNLYMRVWKDYALIETAPSTPFEMVTPYVAADVRGLRFGPIGDIIYVTHSESGYPLSRITRVADDDWTFEAGVPLDGSDLDKPTGLRLYNLTSQPNPFWLVRYYVSALYEEQGESLPASCSGVTLDDPTEKADVRNWGGVVWDIDIRAAGDPENIIVPADEASYDWINFNTYSGSSAADNVWFLAKKGTGTNIDTNPAQDPDLLIDRAQIGIAKVTKVSDGTVYRRLASPVDWDTDSRATTHSWLYGSSLSVNSPSGRIRSEVGFSTLWMKSSGVGVKPTPGEALELHLEVPIGYRVYREQASYAPQTDEWGAAQPAGLVSERTAYGGSVISVNLYADGTDYPSAVKNMYQQGGDINEAGIAVNAVKPPPKRLFELTKADAYPALVGFFAQRLVLANLPRNVGEILMSRTGEYEDFRSVETNATPAGPLKRELQTVSPIRAIAADKSLLVFTEAEEYRIFSSEGALTSDTIDSDRIGRHGIAVDVVPLQVDDLVLYVSALNKAVYAIEFDLSRDKYQSQPISSWSDHLLEESPIIDWAFITEPDKTVMAATADGGIIVVTFETQQQVNGWAKYELMGGKVKSVVASRGDESYELWALVEREVQGVTKQYIEVLDDRRFDRIEDAFFVDSGLSLAQPEIEVLDAWFDGDNVIVLNSGHGLLANDIVQLQVDGFVDRLVTKIVGFEMTPVVGTPVETTKSGRECFELTDELAFEFSFAEIDMSLGESCVWVWVSAAVLADLDAVVLTVYDTDGNSIVLTFADTTLEGDRWNRLSFNLSGAHGWATSVSAGWSYQSAASIERVSVALDFDPTPPANWAFSVSGVDVDKGERGEWLPDGYRFKVQSAGTRHIVVKDVDGADTSAPENWLQYTSAVLREVVTEVSGLDHLIGHEVAILADGREEPRQYVDLDGKVYVPNGCVKCHVGIPITAEFVMPPFLGTGGENTLVGAKGTLNRVYLQVLRSKGLEIGPSFENLLPAPSPISYTPSVPTDLVSGVLDITPIGEWTDGAQLFARQKAPLPVTILSVTPDYEISR